jgi:hypothetical protein
MKYGHKTKGLMCVSVFLLIPCILFSQVFILPSASDSLPPCIKTISWHCQKINRTIPLKVYSKPETNAAPVIVYVKNYNWERLSSESDSQIVSDLIQQGYIVIVADFENDPNAFSPYFDEDLHDIFKGVYDNILLGLDAVPIPYQCYFLPAGYRIQRNVEFWDIQKNGWVGTMEHVVKTYNTYIIPSNHFPVATSPEEMMDPTGAPLDQEVYKLRMDIIYPSLADAPIPLMCNFATELNRNPYANPAQMRMHMAGFALRGYAVAFIDHCWNPLARCYGFNFGSFTLDPFDGLAANTAAIRYLRQYAGTYNIDTANIGAWGHSKGSYAVTRLSDPNHETGKENKTLSSQSTLPPQPWMGYSSVIQAGYQSMGFGTLEHQYVVSNYVPTIIACGEYDKILWADWPALVSTYEAQGVNYLALAMYGLGHTFPSGYDETLDVDRYDICFTFFDQYLKAKENLKPAVLYVRADDTVTVHFAPEMDPASVAVGMELRRESDGERVNGVWKASLHDTRYVFKSGNLPLEEGMYKLVIKKSVHNKRDYQIDHDAEYILQIKPVAAVLSNRFNSERAKITSGYALEYRKDGLYLIKSQ